MAAAHPLGNFTINRHATVELSGDRIFVHYALDLAEIPTFQLGDRVRGAGFAADAGGRLQLLVDGRRAPLRLLEQRVSAATGRRRPEDAPLRRRLRGRRARVAARVARPQLRLADRLARDRRPRRGRRRSPQRERAGESASDELRVYPNDLLRSPLDVTSATARFSLGTGRAPPPSLTGAAAAEHTSGGFESLISRGDLSLGVILLSLLIAAFWGAAHALTPGHGKAIVAGYLVGTKGRPVDAVLLGGIVTITHTIGVFALGFVTLLLSHFIVPETLYPWLTLTSGLLVVVVGGSVLWQRARGKGHDHDHHHHHQRERAPPPRSRPRSTGGG